MQQQQAPNTEGRQQTRKMLDVKHMKVENFGGDASDWDEWAYTSKRVVKAQSPQVYEALLKAETQKTEMEEDDFNDDQKAVSAELYDIYAEDKV